MSLKINTSNVNANLKTLLDFMMRINLMKREQQGTKDYLRESFANNSALQEQGSADAKAYVELANKLNMEANRKNEDLKMRSQMAVEGDRVKKIIEQLSPLDRRMVENNQRWNSGEELDIQALLDMTLQDDVAQTELLARKMVDGYVPTKEEEKYLANIPQGGRTPLQQQMATRGNLKLRNADNEATRQQNERDRGTREYGFWIEEMKLLNEKNKMGMEENKTLISQLNILRNNIHGAMTGTDLKPATMDPNLGLKYLKEIDKITVWALNGVKVPESSWAVLEDAEQGILTQTWDPNTMAHPGQVASYTGRETGTAGLPSNEYLAASFERIDSYLKDMFPGLNVPPDVIAMMLKNLLIKKLYPGAPTTSAPSDRANAPAKRQTLTKEEKRTFVPNPATGVGK